MGKKIDLNKISSLSLGRKRRPKINNNYNNYNNNNQNNVDEFGNEIQQDENNDTNSQRNTRTGSSMFSNFKNKNNTKGNIRPTDLKNVTIKFPKIIIIKLILIIAPILVFLFLAMSIVLLFDNNSSSGIATAGYYASKCPEINVIHVDKKNGYTPIETETVAFEDYIAGVVSAEVGGLANKEIYKVYALAARNVVLRRVGDSCTVENSSRVQNFNKIIGSDHPLHLLIYEAVEETAGQVILENGELKSVMYDAFCSIDKDENYYTVKQQNQKIPVEWVEAQGVRIASSWKEGTCKGNHGKGISTWGAYYLATEKGYTWDQILTYYLGNEFTISSNSFTSIAGLEIKDTKKAKSLNKPIEQFLQENGATLEELNSFVKSSVEQNGPGTRQGVVTAAVSLINYLYDNFDTKLPYWWGGKVYSSTKIPSTFGKYSPKSTGKTVYNYVSFDCSGFVNWAINAGGYKFGPASTIALAGTSMYKNGCDIAQPTCVGQPGDLINARSSNGGHVELIVAVDQENGTYYVAESNGGSGVVIQQRGMHERTYKSGQTRIMHMDEYYNNPNNINSNY